VHLDFDFFRSEPIAQAPRDSFDLTTLSVQTLAQPALRIGSSSW
jgi:hypothetical protein